MKRQLLTIASLSLVPFSLCFLQHRQVAAPLISIGYGHALVLSPRCAFHHNHRVISDQRRNTAECKAPKRHSILRAENTDPDRDRNDDQINPSNEATSSLAQRFLPKGYMLCKYLFATTSLLIFATPDRSMGTMLLQHWSGGAGYACAAALFDTLQTANAAGRQGSDTYKRLHLALAMFSIVNLAALPGEAGFFRASQQQQVMNLLSTIRTLGATVAVAGWISSVKKPIVKELTSGFVETMKGLRVVNRKKALSYRNSLLIVLCAGISSFFQGRFLLSYQKDFLKSNFEISLQWSAVARLSMLAAMIFTLKDAAERDRLDGSTFIKLNVLVGLVSVAAGLGQAAYPAGVAARRGVLFLFFSGLFFLKAYKGQLAKQLKQRSN